jgi:hypothetical protein
MPEFLGEVYAVRGFRDCPEQINNARTSLGWNQARHASLCILALIRVVSNLKVKVGENTCESKYDQ